MNKKKFLYIPALLIVFMSKKQFCMQRASRERKSKIEIIVAQAKEQKSLQLSQIMLDALSYKITISEINHIFNLFNTCKKGDQKSILHRDFCLRLGWPKDITPKERNELIDQLKEKKDHTYLIIIRDHLILRVLLTIDEIQKEQNEWKNKMDQKFKSLLQEVNSKKT